MLEQLIERILPTIIAALELMGIFIVCLLYTSDAADE